MTTTDEAIAGVRDVLFESDQDLYVYAPPGETRFIGEAIVSGAAVALLGAFFGGVKASAEKRMEAWGQGVGDWLFDCIGELFQGKHYEERVHEANLIAAEAKRAVEANPEILAVEQTLRIEVVLKNALVKHNLPLERAEEIARAVSAEGRAVLQA
jgi:hypothetical protein